MYQNWNINGGKSHRVVAIHRHTRLKTVGSLATDGLLDVVGEPLGEEGRVAVE